MHKSALTFGLLASSLVMLAIMPLLNQNNSFFQMQWLKNMTNMEIVLIANIQQTIRNMSVEQVHLKAFCKFSRIL